MGYLGGALVTEIPSTHPMREEDRTAESTPASQIRLRRNLVCMYSVRNLASLKRDSPSKTPTRDWYIERCSYSMRTLYLSSFIVFWCNLQYVWCQHTEHCPCEVLQDNIGLPSYASEWKWPQCAFYTIWAALVLDLDYFVLSSSIKQSGPWCLVFSERKEK